MAGILWDAGTAITGDNSASVVGDRCRVSLTTIPVWQSKSGSVPPRYFSLGVLGFIFGSYRDVGQNVRYGAQGYIDIPADATGIYWSLTTGVSGTLYQGMEADVSLAQAARVRNSGAQTCVTAVAKTLNFDLERYDPWGMHDPASNTKLTALLPGIYEVGANVAFVANAVGKRQVSLFQNGVTEWARTSMQAATVAGETTVVQVTAQVQLSVGDYVEVQALQTSGGNLDTVASSAYSPEFWMALLPG